MILRKRAADIVGRWGVDNKKCEDFSVIIGECGVGMRSTACCSNEVHAMHIQLNESYAKLAGSWVDAFSGELFCFSVGINITNCN
jgi:hypothetical protein